MARKPVPFNIKIRHIIIEPGQRLTKPRKKTYEEIGLRGDMSQFYPLKALFERLLGKPTYMKIKESAHLPYWRTATLKLLDAMRLSIRSTVHVADADWFAEVDDVIDRGKDSVKDRDTIADLFASLSTTLIELSFTQMGGMPARRYPPETIPLTPKYWTFDGFRSVQYVQSPEQIQAVEAPRVRREQAKKHAAEKTGE